MAQNNWIDFIRNTTIRNDLPNEPSVLDASEYTNLMSYSLEVPNTKIVYSKLIPPNVERIFNMDLSMNTCIPFQLCNNTNLRANRRKRAAQLPMPISNYIRDADRCSCINALNLVREHKINKYK